MSMKIKFIRSPNTDAMLLLNNMKKESYDGMVYDLRKNGKRCGFTHIMKRAGMSEAVTYWQRPMPFKLSFKQRAERRILKLVKLLQNKEGK